MKIIYVALLCLPLSCFASSVSSGANSSVAASSLVSSAANSSVASSAQKLVSNVMSDKKIYAGDKISFPVKITKGDSKNPEICIPAHTDLRILSESENKGKIAIKANSYHNSIFKGEGCEHPLDMDTPVEITQEDINTYSPDRFGFTYGGLAVPYKYHYKGSKNFEGGATLAPYFGYRADKNDVGLGFKYIVFAGLSKVDVKQNIDGKETSQSLIAFSYGGGIIGEIKGSFQMGIVFGKDRLSDSSKYADNGKTWVSLAIGFPFDN